MQLNHLKTGLLLLLISISFQAFTQFTVVNDSVLDQPDTTYKKRVLEHAEISILNSLYGQQGNNAATSGGIGTEKLMDVTPTIVVSIPLNDDDVLSVDAGISAYTSASSSNINPFDGRITDPFQASSGASSGDVWMNVTATYAHSSDDRNKIWSAKTSVSNEFDYFSVGFGGGKAWLFNEKNTEFSIHSSIYLDQWKTIYPVELRPNRNDTTRYKIEDNGTINYEDDEHHFNINDYVITGDTNYNPVFSPFKSKGRNSYSVTVGFSQVLSKKVQFSISNDVIYQQGLLSTPFHRIHFADVNNSYIEGYHLADDVERMPDTRIKYALGTRFNVYLSKTFVLRTFYRYYIDSWKIGAHTASLELPIRLSDKFSLVPSYRFYTQSATEYFAPYDTHLSTEKYYTSDYDLSKFSSNQFGMGISYTDVMTKAHIWKLRLKSIDLQANNYRRNTSFRAFLVAFGVKFIVD
ncbi:MAG: DUF3570 domain-containing protein [Flavobacteriales bacterium]|nr:DUF3570 domain-containing protein [Flavobacteriales bacterium]